MATNKKPFTCKSVGTGHLKFNQPVVQMRPTKFLLKEDGDLNDKPVFAIVMEAPPNHRSAGIQVVGQISLAMLNDGLSDIGYQMVEYATPHIPPSVTVSEDNSGKYRKMIYTVDGHEPVEFINGVQRAEEYSPDKFKIPTQGEINKINTGDYVKVGIKFPDMAERFWCEVVECRGDVFSVIFANDLVTSHPTDPELIFDIHKDFIIGVYEPQTLGI
jgi:hypothetical protein